MTPELKEALGMGRWASVTVPQRLTLNAHRPFVAAFADARGRGASPLSTMQFCDTQTMLRDDLLHKCDRVTMAVALEARVPFLDHVLVEWAFGLPDGMRVRGRTLKYLLKQWLSRRLPPELIYRRKQGFEVPVYDWLTGPLRSWVQELLLSPGALGEGFFRPKGVRQLVDRMEAGERTLALPVYSLVSWELWRQQFGVSDCGTSDCRLRISTGT
jgi:asparagine synthase (glutamine-hydrolysing)